MAETDWPTHDNTAHALCMPDNKRETDWPTHDNIIRRMRCACRTTRERETGQHMTIRRTRCACRTTNSRIHTLRICNTYCFSTVTKVTRNSLCVTLYVHCPFCYYMTLHYASHNVFTSLRLLAYLLSQTCYASTI